MLGGIEGLNIIQYFPPKASYFLVVSPDDCRGNLVGLDRAHEEHETGGKGVEHNL